MSVIVDEALLHSLQQLAFPKEVMGQHSSDISRPSRSPPTYSPPSTSSCTCPGAYPTLCHTSSPPNTDPYAEADVEVLANCISEADIIALPPEGIGNLDREDILQWWHGAMHIMHDPNVLPDNHKREDARQILTGISRGVREALAEADARRQETISEVSLDDDLEALLKRLQQQDLTAEKRGPESIEEDEDLYTSSRPASPKACDSHPVLHNVFRDWFTGNDRNEFFMPILPVPGTQSPHEHDYEHDSGPHRYIESPLPTTPFGLNQILENVASTSFTPSLRKTLTVYSDQVSNRMGGQRNRQPNQSRDNLRITNPDPDVGDGSGKYDGDEEDEFVAKSLESRPNHQS